MADRRTFLKMLATMTAGVSGSKYAFSQEKKSEGDQLGEMLPTRRLGKTGKKVTMLGVGGYHLGSRKTERDAQEIIETALEGGVRFFDSAEGYQDGESEKRYGKFLTPKYREHVFLMTKVEQKDAASARKSLDESLKRLNTDYLDLWQMHTLESVEDVDERVAGGVLDVMREAKESGKVRHIGFTGHATPSAHKLMLEKTDIFETCQMPINICDPSFKSFIVNVLPTLLERNMGILAMKTLCEGALFNVPSERDESVTHPIIPNRVGVKEALSFVWSLPVSVVITGPDNADMVRQKIKLARSFTEISEGKRLELVAKVADYASGGAFEDYKYGEFLEDA